ncbi:helix-turn-helix domain-containing protein [uncultured Mycolicibacterium sp.]|uniref:helix-turn-helix domain-containing protein n=1 Tax=uncultured Mycolicibacterium sp. TaxID=2320817 RepID=UPI0026188795|nr:helix-turn-helix domain-containing protein [uncultured Mycolicibacterium sp.]
MLAELGPNATLLGNHDSWLHRPVRAAVLWLPPSAPPDGEDILVVCPQPVTDAAALEPLLGGVSSRIVALAAATEPVATALSAYQDRHAILRLVDSDAAADVIAAVARATQRPEAAISRRLTSLQRTLSQALSDQSPVEGIINRLKRMCNATIALVDRHGRAMHTTGPVPLSLLYRELTKTEAESQIIDVDGWHGVAVRVTESDDHVGWLMATTRRPAFPDPYAISAVQIAATLVEVDRRMSTVSRAQERAIRATVLEQAIALRPNRDNPELAGRISGLGITFGAPLRVVVLQPIRSPSRAKQADALEQLAGTVGAVLAGAAIPHLLTIHDRTVVVLAQADTAEINSLFADLQGVHRGIGRTVTTVADIADSYHDAQLAVRSLRRDRSQRDSMSYEDFDFATALFSDVGLDRMAERARSYLAPICDREALVEALQTYFDHGQNVITAADKLHIHHNSLRYRLSRIESALDANLKDAGDIASVFLALTALDLVGDLPTPAKLTARTAQNETGIADIAVTGAATEYPGGEPSLGVVRSDG